MIPNAERADATDEDIAVATIAVTDQITRDLLPTTCFSQLVGDPLCRGVCGDAEPQNLPAVKTHDQQPVEQPERDRRHHEQVDRNNPVRMVAQECLPTNRRITRLQGQVMARASKPGRCADANRQFVGGWAGVGIPVVVTCRPPRAYCPSDYYAPPPRRHGYYHE